jgi:hypothetical protein
MDKMEWNLTTIGIIIGIFLIGYIIGLVEAAIKQKFKDKKKAHLEEKEIMELPPSPVKQPNLLNINRNSSNDLVLELNGQTISTKDELTADNRRILINLLVEVRPWLETSVPTTTPQTETQPESINIQPQAASPTKPPKSTSSPQSTPVASTESIVSQIDSVLQNRLAASSLANQGIRLQESPMGGVHVYVGLDKYEGIDAIPDPEIKAFIRQAIAEWEGRS